MPDVEKDASTANIFDIDIDHGIYRVDISTAGNVDTDRKSVV